MTAVSTDVPIGETAQPDVSNKPPKIPRVPNIRPQDTGLKILHDLPSTDDIEVDVVAVHGIGVDPTKTWIHRPTGTNWLADSSMLPAVLPNARIMAFGYDSVWWGESAVKQSLEAVGNKLLRALKRKREDDPHRPIIFIGHCFGGLVIQEAYVKAALLTHDFPHVANSVVGMVFLGTPHNGITESTRLATQAQIYSAIVQAELQIEDNALLTMAHDNEILRNAVDKFNRLINTVTPQPTIFCFYEQRRTKVGLAVGANTQPDFVVNQTSGTMPGHPNEGLPLDHFSINKFEDCEDDNFLCVSDPLSKMAKTAKDMREMAEANLDKSPMALKNQHIMPKLGAPIAAEESFAPRGGVIQAMDSFFRKRRVVALYGPSGSGKTHVAVKYAHQYGEANPGANVYWANASSLDQLEASYRLIAERLHINPDDGKDESVIRLVRQRLRKASAGNFLLILDGLNSEDSLLGAILPNSDKPFSNLAPDRANILITTRSRRVATGLVNGQLKYTLEIAALGLDDASQILLERVSKDPARLKSVEHISSQLRGSAGGLALAFSYLKSLKEETSRRKYLDQLKSRPKEQPGVVRAWELLYNHIKTNHPETVDTLLTMSSLKVQCVPAEFFERSIVEKVLPVLTQRGVVEPTSDRQHFTMAPMFRKCAQELLSQDKEQLECIEDLTLNALCRRFNDDTDDVLLPCALAALKLEHVSLRGRRDQAALMFSMARHYVDVKKVKKALKLLRQCLKQREEDAGLPDKEVLVAKTKKAIQDAESVAAEREVQKRLHDSANQTPGNTGLQSRTLGNPDSLSKYIISQSSAQPVDDCLEVARGQYNEALAEEATENFEKAETLYLAAISRLQDELKMGNTDAVVKRLMLKILSSLGSMRCRQGHLQEAEQIFTTILPEQISFLGKTHPETLLTRNDAALLLQELDPAAAAQELSSIHEYQVSVRERQDAASLRTESNIALTYALMGRVQDAERLYGEVVGLQREVLGGEHRDTLTTEMMRRELVEVPEGH